MAPVPVVILGPVTGVLAPLHRSVAHEPLVPAARPLRSPPGLTGPPTGGAALHDSCRRGWSSLAPRSRTWTSFPAAVRAVIADAERLFAVTPTLPSGVQWLTSDTDSDRPTPPRAHDWQEGGLVDRTQQTFGVPLSVFKIDGQGRWSPRRLGDGSTPAAYTQCLLAARTSGAS
jgi:hypothetical protein